jgi:hypothetical protein
MNTLCGLLLEKIHEQIERTVTLIGRVPEGKLDWTPPGSTSWPVGVLLGHILDCLAGFCAVFAAFDRERFAHFAELRNLPVNHRCSIEEAVQRIGVYVSRIDEGFAALQDDDLAKRVPTIFVADGECLLTLLLGNFEHLLNHKYQLFTYLKFMGLDVSSADLYYFRQQR